jgi:hypothetical protein
VAFRPHGSCKSCAIIFAESKDDPTKSKLYRMCEQVHLGAAKRTHVQKAYPQLNYMTLRNHINKHQNVTETKRAKLAARDALTQARSRGKVHHTERRSGVMEWLMEKVESGEVKPTAAALVALLKQEADIEAKQTDQVIEIMKLVNAFVATPLPYASTKRIVEGEVVNTDSTPSPL